MSSGSLFCYGAIRLFGCDLLASGDITDAKTDQKGRVLILDCATWHKSSCDGLSLQLTAAIAEDGCLGKMCGHQCYVPRSSDRSSGTPSIVTICGLWRFPSSSALHLEQRPHCVVVILRVKCRTTYSVASTTHARATIVCKFI